MQVYFFNFGSQFSNMKIFLPLLIRWSTKESQCADNKFQEKGCVCIKIMAYYPIETTLLSKRSFMKPHVPLFFVTVLAAALLAQNTMQVKRVAGTNDAFLLETIGKITFTATDMVLSGPGTSIPVGDISKIFFSQEAVKISPKTAKIVDGKNGIVVTALQSRVLISCIINQRGTTTMSVSNIRGQVIKSLTDEASNGGTHSFAWNRDNEAGQSVSAGVYFLQASINGKQITSKQFVIK